MPKHQCREFSMPQCLRTARENDATPVKKAMKSLAVFRCFPVCLHSGSRHAKPDPFSPISVPIHFPAQVIATLFNPAMSLVNCLRPLNGGIVLPFAQGCLEMLFRLLVQQRLVFLQRQGIVRTLFSMVFAIPPLSVGCPSNGICFFIEN